MPTPADQLPGGMSGLAREIADLKRQVAELRAARRLESAAIGGGGLTVQDAAGGPRIVIVPAGSTPSGELPGILYYSGDPAEITPGYLAWSVAPSDSGGVIPSLELTTPDLGYGAAYTRLTGGGTAGDLPTAVLAADNALLTVESDTTTMVRADQGGFTFDASGGRPTGETWTTLSLNNSWTAYGSPYQTPIYRKQVDGVVQLFGLIAPGTTTAGTTVATLPVGYRPASDHIFKTSGGASTAFADLYVKSNGTITIQNTGGTITWLSLSGVRFPV